MLTTLGQLFNHYWPGFILIPLLLIVSYKQLKNIRGWLFLWGSFLIMQAVVQVLKFTVSSQRPIGDHNLSNPSFPSGVAADGGFFAMYLSILYPKYWMLFHIIGIGMALLRVYVGAHNIIDVVAGYAIGVAIVWLIRKRVQSNQLTRKHHD